MFYISIKYWVSKLPVINQLNPQLTCYGLNQFNCSPTAVVIRRSDLSRIMRKPDFCLYENKGADQLCSYNQRLCFRYTDSTTPLLPKSEISILYSSFATAQAGLCQTWSETPKTCFFTSRLTSSHLKHCRFLGSNQWPLG